MYIPLFLIGQVIHFPLNSGADAKFLPFTLLRSMPFASFCRITTEFVGAFSKERFSEKSVIALLQNASSGDCPEKMQF
jgi:hypothetical protein